MKKEYDFSKAERGRFHFPDARFNLPIYLDDEVRDFVEAIAKKRKTDPARVVNDLLRADKQVVEASS